MQTKKMDMLAYLVELYKELYTHKDILKIKFKYSVSEVEDLYEQMKDTSGNYEKTNKNEEKIRASIYSLKNPDDIKNYLFINDKSKDDIIKDLNLNEFAYLYNVIYSSPLKSNMRKIDAFNSIEKYFNGISRAISMKP